MRLGVVGGTFDPIHLGHMAMAEAAADCARLARVLLLPAAVPPHRRAAIADASGSDIGNVGRNDLRGPRQANVDFAVTRRFLLRETSAVEFRAEFFNVFNLVNFGLPSNILRGSGFGIISKTAGSSRQIQFSLKVIY